MFYSSELAEKRRIEIQQDFMSEEI